ncbi:MAG: cobalamin B12-binding domain-containing protein [Acidimicrobiia bacterium]|nr:cobalamin B12-binding domain-containing protein [Acidimicrobiia bacterium]
MIASPDAHGSVEPYLERAIRSDDAGAVRLVLDLLDHGASTEAVVVDLLAAAQRESGDRWLHDDWTVADEHVVSGVTQRSLDAVANTVAAPQRAGAVVVACAEGDWHSLPAQMCAEILRARGYAVSFLGASTPAEHVERFLTRERPDALVLTCSIPLCFSGIARVVTAAHRVGTPVLAGGRALTTSGRALRLGADAWAPDLDGAAARIDWWVQHPPTVATESVALDPDALQLELDSTSVAARAFDSMVESRPAMRHLSASQLMRTSEDLAFIVRFVAAARLVDDPTVLDEFLEWLGALLVARGVPTSALVAGLEALTPLVREVDPRGGELTAAAAERLRRGDSSHASAGPPDVGWTASVPQTT